MHSPLPSILISEGPSSPTSRRSPHLNRAGPRIFRVNLLRRFSLPLRMVMRRPMPFLTAKVPARSISTSLYDLYTPFVTPFVRAITDKSFIPLVRSSPPPMITALTSYHGCLDLHPALLYLTWLPSSCPSWLLGLRNSLSISWRSKSLTSHPVECSQDFPVLPATLKILFLLSPYPL